jgi:hypothetical protein
MTGDHQFSFREAQKATRLAEFQTAATRRMISQIHRVIADFNGAINDLNRAIEAEQIRTRIDDSWPSRGASPE